MMRPNRRFQQIVLLMGLLAIISTSGARLMPDWLLSALMADEVIFLDGFEKSLLPPGPESVATPLSETGTTDLYEDTKFLWNGQDAIQSGVQVGTIDPERVAILRGTVVGQYVDAKPGTQVSIRDHPEFGFTLARADGGYDLVVNGGTTLTLEFGLDGHLTSHRPANVPWYSYVAIADVALVELDAQMTMVNLASADPIQTARGSPVSDGDGTRQATVMFPQGVTAEMMMPDGSSVPLTMLGVRATEFTVGSKGQAAMPAPLPPSSAYTYAAELSVDAALAEGADSVVFSQPVPFYLENFLDFPTGTDVPVGIYDRTMGAWVKQPNGRVIKILSETSGLANLDTDGDDVADAPAVLELLGITEPERQELASLYEPGDTLWRTQIAHFSPVDCNWPRFPVGAGDPLDRDPRDPYDPNNPDAPNRDPDGDCDDEGSIIYCERQALGEAVELAGTDERLHYNSERVRGRRDRWEIEIPLTGASVPDTLNKIELDIDFAGRNETHEFSPAVNLGHDFVFDGLDAYQRPMVGTTRISTEIRYFFPIIYAAGSAGFAVPTTNNNGGLVPGRDDIAYISSRWRGIIGGFDARALGLGGWSLTSHHFFDPLAKMLYRGDGRQRQLGVAETFERIAGKGSVGYSGDGGPALEAEFDLRTGSQCEPLGIDVSPGGIIYVADNRNQVIRAITPEGTIDTVSQLLQANVRGIDVAPDGTIYVAQDTRQSGTNTPGNRVIRVLADGSFEIVAGNSPFGFSGDGGPATAAQLAGPDSVVVAPDGSVYVGDTGNFRIRKVSPAGIISTIAGTGTPGFAGDGGLATEAQLASIGGMALGPDGSLYVSGCERVRRIDPDGIITTVAGGGIIPNLQNPTKEGLEPTAFKLSVSDVEVGGDGKLYFTWTGLTGIAAINGEGLLEIVAGKGGTGLSGLGGHPREATLGAIAGLALAPNGRLVMAAGGLQRAIFGVGSADVNLGGTTIQIPSADGSEVYLFDKVGRHLQTLHGLTRGLLREYHYDPDGRLVSIIDQRGNTLTIHRDSAGLPTQIEAASGQVTDLSLNSDGFIASISNPLGKSVSFTYDPPIDGVGGGLLASMTDERSGTSQFTWDDRGRLLTDTNARGDITTLTRTPLNNGFEILRTSSGREDITYKVEVKAFAQEPGDGQGKVGTQVRTVTTAGGASSLRSTDQSGNRTLLEPDGTTYKTTVAADPRWGTLVPYLGTLEMKKAGKTFNISNNRSTVFDQAQPGGVGEFIRTSNLNGQNSESHYAAATRTQILRTPEGFESRVIFNVFSEISEFQADSTADPWLISYDAEGRFETWDQGGERLYTFAYDAMDRIASVTDSLGDVLGYSWDDADRLIGYSVSGEDYGFSYDDSGNLASVDYGSGTRVHAMAVDERGDVTEYTPPGSTGKYERILGLGGLLQEVRLPSGRAQTFSHDSSYRTTGLLYPEAALTLTYSGQEDIVDTITRTPTTGTAQVLDFNYNQGLKTQVASSGAATGTFGYTYDSRLHLSQISFNSGAESRSFGVTIDPDGKLALYDGFLLTRDGPQGAITEISDTVMTRTTTYDDAPRPAAVDLVVNAAQAHAVAYGFDAGNIVVQKIESVLAIEHTFTYDYDDQGRLDRVLRDATEVEAYTYDEVGNRLTASYNEGPAETAAYDLQDRLATRDGIVYGFDDDGFMATRGADTFSYSATGELLSATVGGAAVNYEYDGTRRRVSRTDSGGTTEYFHGNPDHHIQLTAARDPGDVWTYYFYDDRGFAYAMERGGSFFYIGTDGVGSPRVVVGDTGNVLRIIEYDSFGRIIMDTAPSVGLHLGYAGGLADPVTGLLRFGVRDYEPDSGRWTARDPILFHSGEVNLYVYVHNRPVILHDPLGLFCTGGAVYEGFGGGVKQCWNRNGFSMCSEFGVGYGVDLDFNPFGDLDPNYSGGSISGGVKGGPVGVGAEISRNNLKDCEPAQSKFKAGLGPVEFDLDNLSDPKFDGGALFDLEGGPKGPSGLSGKFAWKECVQVDWWW